MHRTLSNKKPASINLFFMSTVYRCSSLEKDNSLQAQTSDCAELEELQKLLHFPEEVALRLADTEFQLFYQVPPIDYLRQMTLDVSGTTENANDTRSSVSKLIKRFNEVSAWISRLIVSQPSHDERRAVLSCILRIALSSWNIGNFNGAMEILAGLKSNKLKFFWHTITEKETLPVLDFLSAALMSVEYDRALNRALAIAECRVVPFFGAFLRELREILSDAVNSESEQQKLEQRNTSASSRAQREQRQVFISDYNGEDYYFTRIGPSGLFNVDKIYRVQAVMDHISLCHQHFHTLTRISPAPTLMDYLKIQSSASGKQCIFAMGPKDRDEVDGEYEDDCDNYNPVQPLIHDHGISFVGLSSSHTKIDQHLVQILHHGCTVVLSEGADSQTTPNGILFYLRLDRSSSTLTWVRPSWSALKTGGATPDSETYAPDFNLAFNPEESLAPGILTKLALQTTGETSTGSNTLDDGYLDLSSVKEISLGGRDVETDAELTAISHRYGLDHNAGNECAISILYGNGMTDNRLLYLICPPMICRLWYVGLTCIVRNLARQQYLTDRRLLWLREQYLQLYHEGGYCCGPLAADALRAFGGKDWSLTSKKGDELDETSSALRREVSMKIKKKQLLHNQNLKDRSLRGSFVEPVTMCMESTYWQNPMYHRQSTPATSLEPQIDVIRHHSLGHLAVTQTLQPKFERERHGSTEHLWYGRHPRVGSVLYDTQLDFIEFVKLFRSFSLLIRKDLRDLFEQLAVTFRSLSVTATAKDFLKDTNADKKKQRIGLITRTHDYDGIKSNPQKKIYDAIAAASIFQNCTGIDTKHSQVITLSTFTKFLECRQMETRTEDEVKALIKRHEPDAFLSSQFCLSFEGFARYLMDKDNYAFVNERMVWEECEMNRPLSEYFIASSHNTYLTGHQLKGESSVELYGQVLLSGCRCVELDCWDGEDGYPIIYHGHTFTTKIPFNAVVEEINQYAFVSSPYPVILSIENHCSLQQQTRMAQTFQKVFGDKLVKNFTFDVEPNEEPVLPTPTQLKHRILIKNKKLNVVVPTPLVSYQPNVTSTPVRPVSVASRYSIPGRTSSIISNTSSSSFNDDFSDDDFDDEDDDDNMYEKATHIEGSDTPRSSMSHQWTKNSSAKKIIADDKTRKRSSQISKELSDIVTYIQAIKFRGLNIVSPNSSVKQRQRPSVISDVIETSETATEPETKDIRTHTNIPVYQCTSINENTAKRLSRKQPLALLAHTQTQLMRTYPAGMRIDSSNFNPVIFWSFGIQMAALNYQTDDVAMHLNSAMFELNGRCGFISKPPVMRSQSHVMYRRFNPWDKEFDGLHSVHLSVNVISGQYVHQSNLTVSTFVEVEVIGIPADCNKRRTKIIQKNALNPIWNDIFTFRVMFQDLAFLRFSVIDSSNNHLLAQRVLPLKCLKPGYRHLRLRTPQNRPLYMSTLFIYSRVDEESFNHADKEEESSEKPSASDSGYLSISGTPLSIKRRMFFLTVYGVMADEPYTIFKLTQETSTQEVLLQALQKAGLPAERVNDHILVEEVARGWEKKDHDLPFTQRILDLNDHPLEAQSMWKGEGRFVLKRVGDDPSSRAWLSSIRSVSTRLRTQRGSDSNAWDENDNFLVCIYNVSPLIPYAILKVPLNATAQDVLTQALVKARRLEDPANFVIIEELEWGGPSPHLQQRIMEDNENVYNAQSQWQTLGRFILQERQYATPVSLRKNKPTGGLRLTTLDRITRSLNVARNSIKMPVQSTLSESGSSKSQDESWKCKKNLRKREINREVHSDGETLSEEDKDLDFLSTVSRFKKVSLRKFKEWKS